MNPVLRAASLLAMLAIVAGCGGGRLARSYHEVPDDCPRQGTPSSGVGLALSGGGYRAMLFHAGALRRLNELGLLHQVDEISSVSGGSIANGQLALFYAKRGGAPDGRIDDAEWQKGFADPIRRIASTDIRTGPVIRKYLFPWNWFDGSYLLDEFSSEMEALYEGARLSDVPSEPDFVFQATDLSFGASWEFRRWRVGSYKAGYLQPPPDRWSLGRAVATSGAFPPVFDPLPVGKDEGTWRSYFVARGSWREGEPEHSQDWETLDEQCWKAGDWYHAMENLRLQDGGVYDNLALEPMWKDREVLLVSNAGGPLQNEPDAGLLERAMRWSNIMGDQALAMRKRHLMHRGRTEERIVSYWSTRDSREHFGFEGGYTSALSWNFIAQIRSDIDRFSEAEQAILENHGYLVADASLRMVAERDGYDALGLSEDADWTTNPPHPEWLPPHKTECEVQQALFPHEKCD